MSLHFPDLRLGTAPSGLMTRSGVGKGPAVCPAEHSAFRYCWMTSGLSVSWERSEEREGRDNQ